MPQNCHSAGGDSVLPNPYPCASAGTDKVQWYLLSGTPVIAAGYIKLAVTQAKKVDKKQILIT